MSLNWSCHEVWVCGGSVEDLGQHVYTNTLVSIRVVNEILNRLLSRATKEHRSTTKIIISSTCCPVSDTLDNSHNLVVPQPLGEFCQPQSAPGLQHTDPHIA